VLIPMKASEKKKSVRELNHEELVNRLRDLKEELFNLRFQLATGHLANPSKIREVRKDIARVHTVQRERELQAK
jgi:large subunit ribosomal protein L29